MNGATGTARLGAGLAAVALLLASSLAAAQENAKVGVEEQLGKTISLDQLTFRDEAGKPVTLRSLFDRPVILTLVYFHCPGICSPLLNEIAHAAGVSDLTPGRDYRLITISFDPKETCELAARKREAMLGQMTPKRPTPDACPRTCATPAKIRMGGSCRKSLWTATT